MIKYAILSTLGILLHMLITPIAPYFSDSYFMLYCVNSIGIILCVIGTIGEAYHLFFKNKNKVNR